MAWTKALAAAWATCSTKPAKWPAHNPPQRLREKYKSAGKLAAYYAMCEWFDETCGQLLGHLDKQGLAENTMVVYVCDNGWPAWAKGSPYDLGMRSFDDKKLSEARTAFERARDMVPTAAGPWRWLGIVALRQKRYGDCVAALEEALRLNPRSGHAGSLEQTLEECRSRATK